MKNSVTDFAELLHAEQVAWGTAQFPNIHEPLDYWAVTVKHGSKYTKVDVGGKHNRSGKYMVENATGRIFGIKAYGVIHRGHSYGTLDEIADWNWGGYVGVKKLEAIQRDTTMPDRPPSTETLLRGCIGYLNSLPESQKPDPAWFAPLWDWMRDNRNATS